MKRCINLIGTRIGKLLVISRAENGENGRHRYKCLCDCGREKEVAIRYLQRKSATHCGCSKKKRKLKVENPALNRLIQTYKSNAKKKNHEISLTLDHFEQLFNGNCYYCGNKPSRVYKHKQIRGEYTYNGIDRMDNEKGYIIDNCVSCCTRCNYMKSSMSTEEFLSIIYQIAEYAKDKKPIIYINPKLL